MTSRPDLLPIAYRDKVSHLVEEIGEVLQALGKLDRFGEKATDPKTGIKYDNIGALRSELQDLVDACEAVRKCL